MDKTATVKVLTAEVRVLMVGHRQVTLSVFRQLDSVPKGDIDPFGRVRDPKHTTLEGISVVGRNKKGGGLVRSWLCLEPPPESRWADPESYRGVGHDAFAISAAAGVQAQLDRWEQEKPFADDWARLPLIVLAGLT